MNQNQSESQMHFVVCVLFVLLCVVASVCAHPSRSAGLTVRQKKLAPGEIPPFRSFHVHFLFEKRRGSDTCTGYDDAMKLRAKFVEHFQVSEAECQADFDVGQMCMFAPSLTPFGPFPGPEWAAFVPLNRFNDVVQWTMQNRGAITAFIHPNSGYEREDHSVWAMWAGVQRPLDLSDYEFSEQLAPLFNTSCREEAATYPYPQPNTPLSPSNAHVRVISQQVDHSLVTVTLNGAYNIFPTVSHLDQTWYRDIAPTASATFCAIFQQDSSCVAVSLVANSFHSLLLWNGQLYHYNDANDVADNESRIRVINLLGAGSVISVRRDGLTIVNGLKNSVASDYDAPTANAQHLYEIIDSTTGNTVLSEPYYTNAGAVETIIALSGIPSEENPNASAILLFDYPHDSPWGRR